MLHIGLFYGSTNGNTAQIAQMIQRLFAEYKAGQVELFDIADFYLETLLDFDHLILGVPTWDTGQLQKDWEKVFAEFDELDLTGKKIALFGLGDQVGYPDTFLDALFFVGDKVRERGAQLVGAWPLAGYHFEQSWAVEADHFIGLALDEHNQSAQTSARVEAWVQQLIAEFAGAGLQRGKVAK
jgi:flavodoxin long chain